MKTGVGTPLFEGVEAEGCKLWGIRRRHQGAMAGPGRSVSWVKSRLRSQIPPNTFLFHRVALILIFKLNANTWKWRVTASLASGDQAAAGPPTGTLGIHRQREAETPILASGDPGRP